MSTDLHFVIRSNVDGTFTAITGPVPWAQAQERYQLLSGAVFPSPREYFVRSVDDPRWNVLLAFHKGVWAFRTAAKHAGDSRGLVGTSGGWIRNSYGEPIAQGWDSYGIRYHTVVRGEHKGVRGAWALLRGTDPVADEHAARVS